MPSEMVSCSQGTGDACYVQGAIVAPKPSPPPPPSQTQMVESRSQEPQQHVQHLVRLMSLMAVRLAEALPLYEA